MGWYNNKGKSQCPVCGETITQSDFEKKIFIVMSKAQEQEINDAIKNEFIAYLNSLCMKIKFY